MELMKKRRKHFAELRVQEKRNKPPTKAYKRTQMSTYLKHMGGYKHKQLMGKTYDEIQKLFDKEMKRVNTFVAMSSEAQESNEKKEEGSEEKAKGSRKKMLGRKRARKEQQQESSKKQRMEEDKESDEVEEVEEDDEAELKKHLVIKKDEDIAIDAIPLATKPPMIIDYKIHKSQVSLITRTKPGVDISSFDDLYNNLRVFENDVKGSTASSSNTLNDRVTSCSNECKESYAKLKKLYDAQREQLSDASIEIKAYTQGLKKVEAQLVAHQQGQLWQAVPTNVAMKVNTVKPIVNRVRPATVFYKTHSPFSRPFNNTTTLRTNFTKQKVNTAEVNAVSAVGGKRETAVKPSAGLSTQNFTKQRIKLQHFNLFSVSQICDKKNKVLFTDSECLVLSLEFKLPDANQVLLRIPRQNNMYSFNLENIVPSERFSWVFFLRTKDETSGILKDFIRQIKNQLNQKVKTIRCDNGTKFKNRDFIEFYGSKGIKREYSNARTPQQNGVAERKNMTLIEAAMTMLDRFIFT
ncbi:ribonuclease H-like domain-containing protein [Tanacetum coccineum]